MERKKLLQVYSLYGENLSGENSPLERWQAQFAKHLEARHKELETWLRERGMLIEKKEKK